MLNSLKKKSRSEHFQLPNALIGDISDITFSLDLVCLHQTYLMVLTLQFHNSIFDQKVLFFFPHFC